MALIKCEECGQMVSDKALACLHCGCPIVANESNADYGTQARNSNMNCKPNRKSNTRLIVVVMGVLALLGIGGWLLYDNQQKRIVLEQMREQARQDSIAVAELREKARQDSIAEAIIQERINTISNEYAKVVNNLLSDEYETYFLLDITKDGIPELFCEGYFPPYTDYEGYSLYVYSIQNQAAKKIYSTDVLCGCYYYQGDGYIILASDDCYEFDKIDRLTFKDGRFTLKTIYEYSDFEGDKSLPGFSEPRVTEYRKNDVKSIKNQVKSYF